MNRVEILVRRVDAFQRRHAVAGVPFAVVQKFGNDQAGGKAALLAYYGLLALFPLLLLFSTTLGFVLGGHPELERALLNSALANFPILGTQLRNAAHPLRGNGLALALGVLGTLYGTQGLGQAAVNAMNTVWNVPYRVWPGFLSRTLRGSGLLVLFAISVSLSATLSAIATRLGPFAEAWTIAGSTAVDFAVFLAAFTMLTAASVTWRDVAVGAAVATAFWEGLQEIGAWYVQHAISHAGDVYGFFAIVIGLLSWLYITARLTLLAAEINVVLRYRLWPRSVTQPPFTAQDKQAFVRLAVMEERRPEMAVSVAFSSEADRQPLDELRGPPGEEPPGGTQP